MVPMSDLVDRLRQATEPAEKLLQEAAEALEHAEHLAQELTETLRAVVDISDSQRSREFTEVKKTLARAKALVAARPAAPQPSAEAAPAPTAQAGPAAARPDEDVISGMYREIRDLLR